MVKNFQKNRYIISELTRKRVKTQYRNSFFGMLWTVLNPLLNMLIMWLIFSQFFGKSDKLYAIYLLSGNIIFSFFSSATNGGLASIVGNKGLLKRVKIEPQLFPFSSTVASFVNFLFSFCAFTLIMIGFQIFGGFQLFSWRFLTLFLMFPALILFSYGIALLLSAIYVFFRDIKYLYSVLLTLWTYLTPIFYKVDMLKEGSFAYTIVKLNPLYYFVRFFRDASYMGWSDKPIQDLLLLYAFGLISVAIGYLIYKPLKKKFMTYI